MCHDSEAALEQIDSLRPDVVFLDIRMPGVSGLEIAETISAGEAPPLVVFSTAYDTYAIQAFQVNATDYILKPFDEKDIQRVVQKLQQHFLRSLPKPLVSPAVGEALESPRTYARKFTVDLENSMAIVDSQQIQLVYAQNRMVFIRTTEGVNYKAKLTLQEFETRLDPQKFFRCHRNYIVNVDQIKAIASWFNRGYLLILNDQTTEVPVSRACVDKLREYIQL